MTYSTYLEEYHKPEKVITPVKTSVRNKKDIVTNMESRMKVIDIGGAPKASKRELWLKEIVFLEQRIKELQKEIANDH